MKVPPGGPGVVLNVGTPGAQGFLPSGVAVDGAGNVYFGDFNNQRIVEVPPGRSSVLNVGSPGGRPLATPFAVAVDGAGNVYISDSNQGRILKVPPGGPGTVFRLEPTDCSEWRGGGWCGERLYRGQDQQPDCGGAAAAGRALC